MDRIFKLSSVGLIGNNLVELRRITVMCYFHTLDLHSYAVSSVTNHSLVLKIFIFILPLLSCPKERPRMLKGMM